jgi:competence protein ComEA
MGWTVIGLAIAGLATAARAQDLPEGKGKDTVETVCSQCHSLKRVTDSKLDAGEWKDLVNRMVENGAPLEADDLPVVIEYLAKNFPKSKPAETSAEKINVNKAAAKELVGALKLTAEEADAVVKYRTENGSFATFEDLEKVPGLDSKKLEPLKDRLTY